MQPRLVMGGWRQKGVHTSRARALCQFPRPQVASSGNVSKAAVTLLVLATLFLGEPVLGVSGHAAQEAPPEATAISLGAVSAAPRGQVMIPLFLTPGGTGAPVGRFAAAIRFEKGSLAFVRAEKGFLLDSVNATFHAEVMDDAEHPGQSVVQLEVSSGGADPKPLREGLVLSLVFRVEADAQPDTTAVLAFDRVTATTPGAASREVTPLIGRQGTVEILRPDATPYVGCFFFTH